MIDIELMQDASEIVHYDTPGIPLSIHDRLLSEYTNMRALCHWHEDIECIYVIDGEMYYDINDEKILLQPGDSLIVNAHQMHYGISHHQKECHFLVIIFHPILLNCNEKMIQEYVRPILNCTALKYIHITQDHALATIMADYLSRICQTAHTAEPAYEFAVTSLLHNMWQTLYQEYRGLLDNNILIDDADIIPQKTIMSYIYKHYAEPLTLEELASVGNISRSKCCKLFKKYLQQSPIDFVNSYRMEISKKLLLNTSNSITDIAISCGYNHLSYFSKQFQLQFGCTPSEFRKQTKR